VANGVVYFQSAFNGLFYALDAASGEVLAQVATGGLSSGPAISRGQIYLGTGDAAFTFLDPSIPLQPGSVVALGLPDAARGKRENTPPTFINRTLTSLVKEGELVTLTGTIVDPDPLDTFFLDVDWGDGIVETFKFSHRFNGTTVNITHRYADAGTYAVSFSWEDKRDFGNSAVLTTTVEKLSPALTTLDDELALVFGDLDLLEQLA
jgi:hypothetical protein